MKMEHYHFRNALLREAEGKIKAALCLFLDVQNSDEKQAYETLDKIYQELKQIDI